MTDSERLILFIQNSQITNLFVKLYNACYIRYLEVSVGLPGKEEEKRKKKKNSFS